MNSLELAIVLKYSLVYRLFNPRVSGASTVGSAVDVWRGDRQMFELIEELKRIGQLAEKSKMR
jgi:hypothetical protein